MSITTQNLEEDTSCVNLDTFHYAYRKGQQSTWKNSSKIKIFSTCRYKINQTITLVDKYINTHCSTAIIQAVLRTMIT